uniref:Uncharacterized protein n=1 Tax=Tanacetum cinerariifolium TaxID=118510 RepID=A0A699WL48_TANCI|nr:hypothetical protein [Tanacetum cinerariifolium]
MIASRRSLMARFEDLKSFMPMNTTLNYLIRANSEKFECIDARVKFDVSNDENDDLSYFMFAKVFSLLSADSEDTIFDPGISA